MINKSRMQRESDETVSIFLKAAPQAIKEKTQRKRIEIKLKNFKIEKELCEDYELLCKAKYTDFTTAITDFIKKEVANNQKTIERAKEMTD